MHTSEIASFADIITLWPTTETFAADIAERGGTARQWKSRNNIPADKWMKVVAAAHDRGFRQVTVEKLATLAASKSADAEDCRSVCIKPLNHTPARS